MGDFWTVIVEAFHAVTQQIGWFAGELISSSGSLHDFLPVVAIGIGVTLFFLGVKAVKSFNDHCPKITHVITSL